MRKPLKFLIGIPAIIIAILFLLSRFDFTAIIAQFSKLNFLGILLACLSIWMSMLISTARFSLINQRFGIVNSWAFFHKVNMLSTLYSIFALPLIMQIAGRIQFGAKEARTLYAPITAFEKSISFGLMLIIAAFSSYAFFETAILDQNFLYALTIMLSVICLVLGISVATFFRQEERNKLSATFQLTQKIGIVQNFLLSVLLQFFILSSYVLLAIQLLPGTSILLLYGAFSLVVLATAIPIGFGGYGVREATAGAVFLSFGLPAEPGIVVGLIYSVTHLLVLGVNIFISFSAKDNGESYASKADKINYSPLWFITAILAGIFMCFQIRAPLLNGMITLNPADLIALIVAINVLIIAYIQRKLWDFWSNHMMWIGIFCFVLMIITGWFIGWINFGSNEWAFANRLLGLISVLSFLFFGASFRQHLSRHEQQLISKIMMLAFIIGGITQIFVSAYLPQTILPFFNWSDLLSGFVGDRNAFSFLGLILITIAASTFTKGQNAFPMQKMLFIFIGIILAMVVISGSRTGWAGVVVLAASLFYFSRKGFLYVVISSSSFFYLFFLLQSEFSSEYVTILSSNRDLNDLGEISNSRYLTWITGLNFFIENPLLGAGLGASIVKIDIVIHNLYLWVAGEMGIIGIFLCLPISYAIMTQAFSGLLKSPSIYQVSLLSFLLVFGAFSLTHDIIYQRILWFGIGYFMASRQFFKC